MLGTHPLFRGSRVSALLLGLAFCFAVVLLPSSAQAATPPRCDWSGQVYTDFYAPPDLGELTPDRLGEVLRVEHIRSYTPAEVANAANVLASAYGAEAYRILYLSQAPVGTPQAVSGLLVVPTGTAPVGGFPVLVHGHGTVGMADKCAPSKAALDVPSLLSWVARGFVVAATDYTGLGVPGLHPYAIGDVAGIAMLDSARTALRFCDSEHGIQPLDANRIILEGHSQGGHSALFAHQIWKQYAPELNLLGDVVFAPGAEFDYLAQHMANQFWSPLVAPMAMAMYADQTYYGAPASLQPWLQEPYATDLPQQAENQCLGGLALWLGARPDKVFQPGLLAALQAGQFQNLQPWTGYVEANTPGNFSSDVPVLVLQGQVDTVIPADASALLVRQLCDNGVPAKLSRYAEAGHGNIVKIAQPDALEWIGDRLSGLPVSDYCPGSSGPLISRGSEPVVIKGSTMPALYNWPVNQLFVYAYTANGWQQIPAQVDEVTAPGLYAAMEDGFLDDNDEIVFMAKDLGILAPSQAAIDQVLPVNANWYAIEVIDPIVPTRRGWAYVVQSDKLTTTAAADYVRFDTATGRIQGENYGLGYPNGDPWLNYLALGDGPNILDRTKVHLDCSIPLICPKTEDKISLVAGDLIKDGPIRVIAREGSLLAYSSEVMWLRPYRISKRLQGDLRVSTDFNAAATGAIMYNAGVPLGVRIDGRTDSVPPQPASTWWQVSTDAGSLIQVSDIAIIGATAANYYVDNSALDRSDTGDQRHYGDTGLIISKPNLGAPYRFAFYVLPDKQPDLGPEYAAFFATPLKVTVSLRHTLHQQYLPLAGK